MSRKEQRVQYHLNPKGISNLPDEDIKAILRGADDLIMRGGRTILAKVLKGSRAKDVLQSGLDKSPVYGFYRTLPADEILARIDWTILNKYLAIEYDGRLPLLIYTPQGWDIEREIYASEFLKGFDERLASGSGPFDMSYLKDMNRAMIWLLLDKVAATRDRKYIPLLEAWVQVDYKKVQLRIRQVISQLQQAAG